MILCDLDPLPYFEEPDQGRVQQPEMLKEYTLVFDHGARNGVLSIQSIEGLSAYAGCIPIDGSDTSDTGRRFGLKQVIWIWIENYLAEAKARGSRNSDHACTQISFSCDHGWWLPEKEAENLYDVCDIHHQQSCSYKCVKSGFGANYKTTLVKIFH